MAEQAGWDGLFLWDHLLFEVDVPFVDAWIALAAIAAATERIRLGPLVTPLPRRRPWKVARESVTLDHLSGGRLVLGVGLGIDFWREFGGVLRRGGRRPGTRRAPRRRHRDRHPALVGRARRLHRSRPAGARRALPAHAAAAAAHPDLVGGALAAPTGPDPARGPVRRCRSVPARRTTHPRPRARAPRPDRAANAATTRRSTCACTAGASSRPNSQPRGPPGSWSRATPTNRWRRSAGSSSGGRPRYDRGSRGGVM